MILVGDDTVDGHYGRKAYGKARHRDPVRSGHGYTAWRYGHKWVVLAVLVRFPGANRPWALPLLVDLYRSEEGDRKRRRPHRTPARVMMTLLRVMLLWFPDRRFVFVGDSGYGTHEIARLVHRHRARLALVSKLHPEANLFEPPPPYRGKGRPPVKGARRPRPREAVAGAGLRAEAVAWYEGGQRQVGVLTGTGQWYKSGRGLVPIVWIFIKDQAGTHQDEYFYSTDLGMTAVAMIGAYAGRWNLETTFQEVRCFLGLETTRGWCRPNGLAGRPVPVRAVYGGRLAVSGPARVETIRSGRVAGQGGRDLLGCPVLGAALAVSGVGFSTGGRGRGRGSTPRVIPRRLVLRPGTGGVALFIPHQSS